MKRIILTLALIATTAFSLSSLRAQDTNTMATNAMATATNAPAASTNMPAATLDQRVAAIEAYFQNGDPTAGFKDTNGNQNVQWPPIINTSLTNSIGSVAGYPGAGHNAWLLTSTALVLFMTLPGLALFYGGLVRRKNVLSVLAQCFLITGLVTILYVICGYGMIFGGAGSAAGMKLDWVYGIIGNPKVCWMFSNVTSAPNGGYSYWVSENVYAMFQMMFAIITPALIVGSIAERMKFKAIFVFITLWMFVVYFTQGHMVWGVNGLMNGCWNGDAKIHGLDFAGGTVVHMTSGWTGLILCLIIGKRLGFPKEPMPPHSIVLTYIGTGMLWVGWYGFNSGSAVHDDCHGGRLLCLADVGLDRQGQTHGARLLLRRSGGPGAHHSGLRLCVACGRNLDWHRRRHHSVVLLQQGQRLARL
jgi:Amt family ammonium transporter